MGALDRLLGRVRPEPSGLVPLRLTRKYPQPGGPVYCAGEIAGFPPQEAARLLAEGSAKRCAPDTQSDVRPRQDPETTWRYVGRPLDDETQWTSDRDSPL